MSKKSFIFILIWALLFTFSAQEVSAQLTRRGKFNESDAYNPKPDRADLIYPMPCNLQMVFKAVSLPVKGLLGDMETRLGTDDDHPNAFFDRKYKAFLGSSLSLSDLPADQRAVAEQTVSRQESDQIYLIGKYEVTNAQWQAVMEGCQPLTADSSLPKTGISWYDTLAFTEKYMTYILQNHPQVLPTFPEDTKNIGLIRLPTEAEWEYAARGGQMASEEEIKSEPIFRMDDGSSSPDYGLFQDGINPPAQIPKRIGSYRANPLGIYDTIGNVAELTSDMFKMTLGNRLHGASGGLIRKGGGFRSDTSEILPGRRVETALFYREGPTQATDLGFRLAMSAVAAPGGSRFNQLRNEWQNAGQAPMVDTGLNPLEKLDRLINDATTPAERAVFESLRADFKDFNIMVQRNQEGATRGHCSSMIYAVFGFRSTARQKLVAQGQIDYANADIKEVRALLRDANNKEKGKIRDIVKDREDMLANAKTKLSDFNESGRNQFNYYKSLLLDSVDLDRKMLVDQMVYVRNNIKGNDAHSREMRVCYDIVAKQLKMVLTGEINKVVEKDLMVNLEKKTAK
jgi:formylglycine-generating enzyme required for sulfatase activity